MARKKGTDFRQQKGFTLIELMATLVILALIIAIAVPAIGKLVSKADASADKSSISLMERAGEMAYIDNLKTDDAAERNKDLPASITEKDVYMIPTLIQAGYLKLDKDSKFNKPENYVKKIDKSGKFIYMGKGKDDSDKPANDDVAMGSCTRDGVYTAATEFDWKFAENYTTYADVVMDKDGNYVAFGRFGQSSDTPMNGYVLDKYDKNLKLIDRHVIEAGDSDDEDALDYKSSTNIFGGGIMMNADNELVVYLFGGITVFDSDLNQLRYTAPKELQTNESMNITDMYQTNNGDYFAVGYSNYASSFTTPPMIAMLDSDFNYIAHERLPGITGKFNSGLYATHLLKNGDLLLAGDDVDGSFMQRLRSDFVFEDRIRVAAPQGLDLDIDAVSELADGTIVSVSSVYDEYTPVTGLVDTYGADLTHQKEVEITTGTLFDAFIHPIGETFMASSGGDVVTYDRSLTALSRVSESDQPGYRDKSEYTAYLTGIHDGDDFITIDTNSQARGIYKTRGFGKPWSDDKVEITEKVPNALPTVPPAPWGIAGPNGYDDYEAYLASLNTNSYISGYDEATNRMAVAYRGSVLMVDRDVYYVDDDGSLMSILDENGEPTERGLEIMTGPPPPVFVFGVDRTTVSFQDGMGGKLPEGLVPVGGVDVLTTVDPCYAGSYMVNLQDMQMYKVQDDGTLKLLGKTRTRDDAYTDTPEDFGFDVWSDAVYYLSVEGDVINFPELAWTNYYW